MFETIRPTHRLEDDAVRAARDGMRELADSWDADRAGTDPADGTFVIALHDAARLLTRGHAVVSRAVRLLDMLVPYCPNANVARKLAATRAVVAALWSGA